MRLNAPAATRSTATHYRIRNQQKTADGPGKGSIGSLDADSDSVLINGAG